MTCPWCANPEGMGPVPSNTNKNVSAILPKDLLQEAMDCQDLFFEGGGLTFTGGEATLQHSPLLEALQLLKKAGIHTAIETNASTKFLQDLLPQLDLLIADYKHWDDEKHKNWTGVSNRMIEENIRCACQAGLQVWVRTPLISGVNAAEEDIAGFLGFFETLKSDSVAFEFLPYHEYGRDKWEKLGRKYQVQDGFIDEPCFIRFEEALKKAGLRVIHT